MAKEKNIQPEDTNNVQILGFDVGTGFLCSASKSNQQEAQIKMLRNTFILVRPEDLSLSEVSESNLNFIEQYNDDNEIEYIAIVGEDALRLSNIFNRTVRRPMQHGMISATDIDAIDIVTKMCESISPTPQSDKDLCVFSIPAQAIDNENLGSITYHESVFKQVFKALGFKKVQSLNEGMSVIYSELSNNQFTGLGISFGAGMVNVAMAYKGTQCFAFSTSRSGDWIDEQVAKSLNIIPNKVTHIKEKLLKLNAPISSKNKVEKRVLEALQHYYRSLVEYTVEHIVEQFNKISDGLDLSDEIPIVISGGTSLAPGFKELFEEVLEEHKDKIPYTIKEVTCASDQLTAVAKGCLIYAMHLNK